MKKAKTEPPTGSELSRGAKLKARRHSRPVCRLDKQRSPDAIGPAGQPAEKSNPDALAEQPAHQPAANPDMKARIDQPAKHQSWQDYLATPGPASPEKTPVRRSGPPATWPPANPDTQTGQPANQTPAKKNPDVPLGQPAETKSHETLSGQPARRPAEKNPGALPGQPVNQTPAKKNTDVPSGQPAETKSHETLSGQPARRPAEKNPGALPGQRVNQTPAKKNPDVPSGQPAETKSHETLSGQPASRPAEKSPDALPGQPASHPAEDWRRALPAEFRNASREELVAVMDRHLSGIVGVNDPDVAKRILGQSTLMRAFGEPHSCNLDTPGEDARALLLEFAPNNIMESMLVVQMSGVHEAALAFLKAAGEPGLSQRQRDAEVRKAKQLMHLFNAQAAMMTK